MNAPRSALFLDFDSVFDSLITTDPHSALRLADAPRAWLPRLSLAADERSRRWLVLRCYLNPDRSVANPVNGTEQLRFSRFRQGFAAAGFEVVGCPPYSHTTNAADIRIVIDALDAARVKPHYDEFVVMSGDSDLTPLVIRLRALDRRVTVISPSEPPAAMRAAADQVIYGDDLLRLLRGPRTAEAEERFRSLVVTRYAAAPTPLNLATLAHEVHDELGPIVGESRWFGHDHFVAAVQSLALPGLQTSQHFLWDQSRHAPPGARDATVASDRELMVRLLHSLKLPDLAASSWHAIYELLAEFVATYEFSISAATRWVQAQLASDGIDVSRPAIGTVMRGAASGGCPLYRQPPPKADEIAAAFVSNVLDRAGITRLGLTEREEDALRAQLGIRDGDADTRAG